MSLYRFILAFHIVAVISWMAGLLYLFRLFVYHAEETEPVVKQRFKIMESRLYKIITVPAMLVTLSLGVVMIILQPIYLEQKWLWAKLFFVVLLIGVTHFGKRILRELSADEIKYSSKFFRIMNEVPTLLMILIVLLVILRPF